MDKFALERCAVMQKTVQGLNINYALEGEGELVVILHGWGSNIKLFDNLIHLLSPKYKVLAMDMPGFGESDEPKEPWDVDNYVDFVLEFLKDFDCDKVTLLGHSFGGRVIIKLNARENLPFKIQRIILVDSAGVKPKKTFKQKVKQAIYKMTKKILMSKLFTKLFPDAMENLRKKNGSADYLAASPIMRQCLVKVVNEDLTHLFPLVEAPTLLIWGRNDTATPISDAELMEKTMKDAGLVVLENCGHYSFLEQQYTFNRVMSSFMKL